MSSGSCEGRVVVVTGAGRGIGREYALEFARQGAMVVVNDLGGGRAGGGTSSQPSEAVVEEIRELGGDAIANAEDVSDFQGARRLIDTAVSHYGRLDTLVNNAGILRDRTLVNMDIEEWNAVIRVHLSGTFCPTRWAAKYWRGQAKGGQPVDARLINTTSSSGIYANPGQVNYASAKGGIASFTIVASRELARYGVTANAVYPTALSRLTEDVFARIRPSSPTEDSDFNGLDPANLAPVVVWLGSQRSASITGRVFGVRGDMITVAEGWVAGPSTTTDHRWESTELDGIIPELVHRAATNAGTNGRRASTDE